MIMKQNRVQGRVRKTGYKAGYARQGTRQGQDKLQVNECLNGEAAPLGGGLLRGDVYMAICVREVGIHPRSLIFKEA